MKRGWFDLTADERRRWIARWIARLEEARRRHPSGQK